MAPRLIVVNAGGCLLRAGVCVVYPGIAVVAAGCRCVSVVAVAAGEVAIYYPFETLTGGTLSPSDFQPMSSILYRNKSVGLYFQACLISDRA